MEQIAGNSGSREVTDDGQGMIRVCQGYEELSNKSGQYKYCWQPGSAIARYGVEAD